MERVIEVEHINGQTRAIMSAKNMSEKKASAVWRSEPFLGKKLPSNFGLPPFHFRCRTRIVPVWIEEEEYEGKVMRYASKDKDDIIAHIDKTGVQRRVSLKNYTSGKHSQVGLRVKKADIISALNSITQIAPKKA